MLNFMLLANVSHVRCETQRGVVEPMPFTPRMLQPENVLIAMEGFTSFKLKIRKYELMDDYYPITPKRLIV